MNTGSFEHFFELIARKRKMFILFNYLALIILGGLMFPISLSNYLPLSLGMLIVYFYLGLIFSGLYHKKTLVVFFSTFILNLIGLSWRALLEWGEYSITRDLTILNVGVYLIFIPLYITLIYLVVQRLKHKNKN